MDPKYLSFHQLLRDRLFEIPDYQRSYSWRKENRKALFDDIDRATGSKDGHFMATVVCLAKGERVIGTDSFMTHDVVDGQQRLTTLLILLKALEKAMRAHGDPELEREAESLDGLLIHGGSRDCVLLQTNHDLDHRFVNYLSRGTIEDADVQRLAARSLVDAMHEAEQFVRGWQDDGLALSDLLLTVKSKLYFVLHVLDSPEAVYRIFDSLNSRGRPVASLDKLKSELLARAYESDGSAGQASGQIKLLWSEIYSEIGLSDGLDVEALKFAGTLRSESASNRTKNESKAVRALLKSEPEDASGAIVISEWVLTVVRTVRKLHDDRAREAVSKVQHARLLAVAIILAGYDAADQERLLDQWERTTFRIYGLGERDTKRAVGDYTRLACHVFSSRPAAKEIHVELHRIGSEFPIDTVVERLREANCYERWSRPLRYVLYRYEEDLAGARVRQDNAAWRNIWQVGSKDSIEHVMPQHTKHVDLHRLGNLTLLDPGFNCSLGSRSPADKAEGYKGSGFAETRRIGDLIAKRADTDLDSWSSDDIHERTECIVAWARLRWADLDVPLAEAA